MGKLLRRRQIKPMGSERGSRKSRKSEDDRKMRKSQGIASAFHA